MEICIASASVTLDGRPVRLAKRERELLMYLAANRRVCRGEEIAEAIWPDRRDGGDTVVRVNVNRLRRRLGDETLLLRTEGGYALAPHVTTDLDELEQELRLLRARAALSRHDREQLAFRIRSLQRPCALAARWEWFCAMEARALELAREIALLLAEQALACGSIAETKNLAAGIIERDCCDEPARELLIRAHVAEGDYAGAMRAFRTYRNALDYELGVPPSPALQALIGALNT